MKHFIIHMIAGLCYAGGAIWGIIEGVDYFVNKNPVNWLFLLPLLGGIFVAIGNMASLFRNNF